VGREEKERERERELCGKKKGAKDTTRHARSVNGYTAHTINRVASRRTITIVPVRRFSRRSLYTTAPERSLPAANRYANRRITGSGRARIVDVSLVRGFLRRIGMNLS